MKTTVAALLSAIALGTAALPASAVETPFDLMGSAGAGLLGGNEVGGVASGGSGGEIGPGISFDSVTNMLNLSIGWGSGNGFADLSGDAAAGHIHGPTSVAAPGSFLENAGVKIGLNTLAGWNGSASSGSFTGSVPLTASQLVDLFDGKLYVNVHTALNGGGEIRGNLLPVPEPAGFAMLGVGLALVAGAVRRRRS